nr:translation initiation factor 1 [Amentotaxus formosana]
MVEGIVTEEFPDGLFTVHLDNGLDVVACLSAKIRYRFTGVLIGDRVKVELAPYLFYRAGRIIFRFPTKSKS